MILPPNILRRVLELEEIPTLPVVMNRILEIVSDDSASSNDLAAVLECDLAVSAQVLRIANSAFYGAPAEIDSIGRAVVLMGFNTVQMLALATSVLDVFSKRQQFSLDAEDFWMHSLGAAKAAHLLARRHAPGVSPDASFTAGLLHDIGKFLLALALGADYRTVLGEAARDRRPICDVERERLGATHADLGGWICEKWHFPPTIIDCITHHHRPAAASCTHPREAALVCLADEVSRAAGFGLAGDAPDLRTSVEDPAAMLRVPTDVVGSLVDEMREMRDQARAFLGEAWPARAAARK